MHTKKFVKTSRNKLFNLNNKDCQKTFKEVMDKTTELTNITEKDDDVDKVTKKFLKVLFQNLAHANQNID